MKGDKGGEGGGGGAGGGEGGLFVHVFSLFATEHVYRALNAVAPENMPDCDVLAADPIHPEISQLKALADLNIFCVLVN